MKAVLAEVSHWHFRISKICLMGGSKSLVSQTKARKSERNILSCLGVKVIMIGRRNTEGCSYDIAFAFGEHASNVYYSDVLLANGRPFSLENQPE